MTLYFDGGARGDPARMEIGVVAHGHAYILDDMGVGDNCMAEWLALRYAASLSFGGIEPRTPPNHRGSCQPQGGLAPRQRLQPAPRQQTPERQNQTQDQQGAAVKPHRGERRIQQPTHQHRQGQGSAHHEQPTLHQLPVRHPGPAQEGIPPEEPGQQQKHEAKGEAIGPQDQPEVVVAQLSGQQSSRQHTQQIQPHTEPEQRPAPAHACVPMRSPL
jgi:hypothetical protein